MRLMNHHHHHHDRAITLSATRGDTAWSRDHHRGRGIRKANSRRTTSPRIIHRYRRLPNRLRRSRLCCHVEERKRGLQWRGLRVHMGFQQEAHDAECAAIAHALESAAFRPLAHEHITTFSDAQAAIRRMGSDEPGPGQRYALEARKHIATIRRRRPGVKTELRWYLCSPWGAGK